jgi:hypothetical protein
MLIKQMSGHSRLTIFSFLIILALCFTAASAATLNTNIVYSKVTQTLQVVTIPVRTVPVYETCPTGYDCMTDADATAQLGTYAKWSDAVCGYKQSTAAVAVIRVPMYCVKKTETQYPATCPEDCSCMLESAAKDKGLTRCDPNEKPCRTATITGAAPVNYYCFGPGTTTTTPVVTCDVPGCNCMSVATAEAKAQEAGGTYTRCKSEICGYEQSTATVAAVVNVPKYCIKIPEATPVCPDGCSCLSESDAKLKGLTKCDPNENPCGYQSITATANIPANRIPLSCYQLPATEPVCPQGCYCLQEKEADAKFGPNTYTRCDPGGKPCGYDPSAVTANGIPKYCLKPTVTPTPAVCPEGCMCTTNGAAVEKGLTFCGGTLTSCGYNENKQPLYCFEQVPSPICAYDYQKNACTGTCDQGYTCGLLASKKDASGKIVYGACGCTGQPTTPCAYDSQKNSCTGTCQSGAACAIVGKKVDEKTGESFVVCGCPQQTSCTYNYDKDACVGTCTATGEVCQLNTIYRDPATGKVAYAECHCKGAGAPAQTCTCDTASGACTGTCVNGKACTMAERSADNAGKVVCKSCGCEDTCVLDANNGCSGTCANQQACTRIVTKDDSSQEKVSCGCGGSQTGTSAGVATPPKGIFEAIASFLHTLFGSK